MYHVILYLFKNAVRNIKLFENKEVWFLKVYCHACFNTCTEREWNLKSKSNDTVWQILLDGSGTLKYADFGLSRVEGEILEELFEKFADAGEMWSNEADVDDNPLSKKYKTTGNYTLL